MPIIGSFGAGSAKGYGLTMAGKKIEGISFLVLAGGGGGGSGLGGGGGAGGYRLADPANPSDKSGGPDNAPGLQEDNIDLFLNKPYSVIVGAGGAGAPNVEYPYSFPGNPSVFATITSIGGGGGASHPGPNPGTQPPTNYTNPFFPYYEITPDTPGMTLPANAPTAVIPPSVPVAPYSGNPVENIQGRGLPGGSGGGNSVGSGTNKLATAGDVGNPALRGPGTPNQGYPGGLGATSDQNPFPGGGGGGVGSAGVNATPGPPAGGSPQPGNGGPGGSGLASSITETPVTRGGGGGGGSREDQGPGGSGGPGGGGSWNNQAAGGAGGTNQGAGGGPATGSNQGQFPAGNGGSGIVVVKIPTTYTATFSPGVTQTPSSNPTHNIYTVTATSDSSQTVTFTEA
jgi:fibronectin-binding autotransporter adhesin